jgi:hypothetical protein
MQKIKEMKKAWQMVDKLRAGREMGSGRLMELTTCFYGLHLADCESIADFSGQLLKVNHGLYDLHPETAFSETQLVLRFLQGLGSGYDIWIQTLTQTAIFITTPGKPAITFESVVQKAYDEEKRQASGISGSGTALLAHSHPRSSQSPSKKGSLPPCTWCKKTSHPPIECFIKYPHKKAAWDEKKRAARKRRNENSDGRGDSKKPKTDSAPSSAEPGETAMAAVMIPGKLMCVLQSMIRSLVTSLLRPVKTKPSQLLGTYRYKMTGSSTPAAPIMPQAPYPISPPLNMVIMVTVVALAAVFVLKALVWSKSRFLVPMASLSLLSLPMSNTVRLWVPLTLSLCLNYLHTRKVALFLRKIPSLG